MKRSAVSNTVCIFSSDDEGEAETIRDVLETNGIPTLVGNRYTQNLFSGITMCTGHDAIVGSIRVIVRDDSEVRRVAERRFVYLCTALTASSFLLAR